MTLQELEVQLNDVPWICSICDKEIDLGLEEELLIQTLKDMSDTSWGRDTLDYEIIGKWLDNFTGKLFSKKYERILALILAVHMVYYNEYDICHLVKLAYRKLLHMIMEQDGIDLDTATEDMIFMPLGTISESGPFMSYYIRKENCLPTEFFVNSLESITQIERIKNVVLIDDVSISGEQVDWYLKQMKKNNPSLEKVLHSKKIYALFLLSTTTAKEKLKKHNVQLCTPILMDERSRCFDEESSIYRIFDKTIRNEVRIQSMSMAQYYGCELLRNRYRKNGELQRFLSRGKSFEDIVQKIKKDALGYGDAQMLIAFEYNTPNNTLPIIWADDNLWNPLFRRYDKLYVKQIVGGIKNENIYI